MLIKSRLLYIILFLLLLFNQASYATHIIGGSLNYLKLADSTYVITLKLYRDCGPSSASLPTNADIEIRGPYGALYDPDLTINIPRISLIELDPVVDTCVVDPGICVEEAIYRDTLRNLPDDVGYHLYYQNCCRNASLDNIVDPLETGESFYAYIPPSVMEIPDLVDRAIWYEGFNLIDGLDVDNGPTAWSTAHPGAIDAQTDQLTFYMSATYQQTVFTTEVIDISAYPGGVDLAIQLFNSGTNLEANDYIRVYYKLNGGAEVLFTNNSLFNGAFRSGVFATEFGLIGNDVQIVVRCKNDAPNEYHRLDNIAVLPLNSSSMYAVNNNSNPEFSNFPPIFVCLEETLVFDHSAFDVDGDSLVYSMYTPFQGAFLGYPGYEDYIPTYLDNDSAQFVPVDWIGGFNGDQPLGANGLSLDPNTGELIVTPGQQGQFVVGVRVDEYRDGIYLGSTVRDFQFNVVYCPPIAEAVIIDSLECNDSTFYAYSRDVATDYFWDFGDLNSTADTARGVDTVMYEYPDNGTYIVTLITNYLTACADTGYDLVVIRNIEVDFDYSSPHCTNDLVDFNDLTTFSNNTSITNWYWDFGTGDTSVVQNPQYTYLNTGMYDVMLQVIDSFGCADTIMNSISVANSPEIFAPPNFDHCSNINQISLNAYGNYVNSVQWHTNGTGTFNPSTDSVTTYTLSALDTMSLSTISFWIVGTGDLSCNSDTDSVTVTILPSPVILPDSDKTICYGDPGIDLVAMASGGTMPYTYSWNNGVVDSSQFVTPGTYISQITDANGCITDFDTVVVSELPDSISITVPTIDKVCSYDIPVEFNASITGSTGATWTGAGTFDPSPDSLNTFYTPTPGEMTAGEFNILVVTTGNGVCEPARDSMTITINTLSVSSRDSLIPGCDLADGFAYIEVEGGTEPYSYQWSANAGGQTTDTAQNLVTGMYYVTVTDSIGCVLMDSFNLDNNQPDIFITDSLHITCFGDSTGMATVAASGGVPGYTFEWDANTGGQIGSVATDLTAGTYFVTVTDNINCKASTSVTLTQPDDSIQGFVIDQTNLLCFGDSNGAVTVGASGGNTGDYTYVWNTVPQQTGPSANNLEAGMYVVTIYDSLLCEKEYTVTITSVSDISANISVVSDFNGSPISCYGASDGVLTSSASGGVGNFTYLWDDTLGQTTATADSLPEGTYTVIITDSNNCSIDTSITIEDPDSIEINLSIISDYNGFPIACNGDSNATVSAEVIGGTPSYDYSWSDYLSQTDTFATQLYAGTYVLIITDLNGCSSIDSVVVNEPPLLTAITSVENVSCNGLTDGEITVFPSGGVPSYSYLWDAMANNQTTQSAINLETGTYSVTVTDLNSCTIVAEDVGVDEPDELVVFAFYNDTICPGESVTISAQATGGNGVPYTYNWNDGWAFGQTIVVSPQQTTVYQVVASDNNDCESQADSITIYLRLFEPDSLYLNTENVCEGDLTSVEAQYDGDLGPYTFQWDNGIGSGSGPHLFYADTSTTFTVTVTDFCQNQVTGSIGLTVYPIPDIIQSFEIVEGCVPVEFSITDSANNGDVLDYFWDLGDGILLTGSEISYTFEEDGYYPILLSMISNQGCTATFDTAQIVWVHPNPESQCSVHPTVVDLDDPVVNYSTVEFDSYFWDFGEPELEDDTSSLQIGTYAYSDTGSFVLSLIVDNGFSCFDTCNTLIRVDPIIRIQVPNVFTPNPLGPNGGVYNINSLTNDVFFPITEYLEGFHMQIFSRWGEMMFETYDVNIGWDGYYRGELCQQDTYIWKITATFIDGKTRELTGDVTLLR